MSDTYRCEKYHIDIPLSNQAGFCAKQYRMERDFCIDCEIGRESARGERDMPMCDKKCSACGRDFRGGPTAMTCPDCHPKAKDAKGGRNKSKKLVKANGRGVRSAENEGRNGFHDSVKVLDTLIAIGAVTEEQVDATRRYVQEMFA